LAWKTQANHCCLDKTKTNQNKDFSKMEKICATRISQKGRKCTKIRNTQRSCQKKRKSEKQKNEKQWPSLPATTLPSSEALTKDVSAFQKTTVYFKNNGAEPEQEETQPDPELTATWSKLLLLISNDTKGYKVTTVEALTHGKGTDRLVYGKHTAMAAAERLATWYRSYMSKARPRHRLCPSGLRQDRKTV